MSTILQIQDKDLNTLAYLNNIEAGHKLEEINGQLTLYFQCDIDPLKTPYLYNKDNFIVYGDDLFRVVDIEEYHNTTESVTVYVNCEHYTYDLIYIKHETFVYLNSLAPVPLQAAVNGTPFQIRKCELSNKSSINYQEEEINSKQALSAIAANWGGELSYYRNYIDLLVRRGSNRGVAFRFGKNMTQIRRTTNLKKGTVSYEVDVEEGSELEELSEYELGDTIRVVDERLDIEIDVRIVALQTDLITNKTSNVTLGDNVEDLRSSFSSVQQTVNNVANNLDSVKAEVDTNSKNWDKINDFVDDSGQFVIGKLNTLTQIASKIVNSTGTFEQRDNAMFWHDQPSESESTFATLWSAQGLVFANSKNTDGTWAWQTAIDANGLVATSLSASALQSVAASVINLVVDTLVGKTITGVTITGSNVYGGDVKAGTYMHFCDDGNLYGYKNGKRTMTLYKADEGRLFLGKNLDDTEAQRVSVVTDYGIGNSHYSAIRSSGDSDGLVIEGHASRIIINGSGNIAILPSNSHIELVGQVVVNDDLYVNGNVYADNI